MSLVFYFNSVLLDAFVQPDSSPQPVLAQPLICTISAQLQPLYPSAVSFTSHELNIAHYSCHGSTPCAVLPLSLWTLGAFLAYLEGIYTAYGSTPLQISPSSIYNLFFYCVQKHRRALRRMHRFFTGKKPVTNIEIRAKQFTLLKTDSKQQLTLHRCLSFLTSDFRIKSTCGMCLCICCLLPSASQIE